jgi:hypothetical protein
MRVKWRAVGKLDRLTTKSPYQLALPFSRPDCREMTLSNALTGTTL